MKIQRCRDGFTDVEEDVTNSITCTDFVDTDTVTWTITKDGVSTDVAMCTPSGCTNHSSDVGAVREAGNKTQLLYPSRDRDQDQGTSVSCTSNKSQTGQRTTSCTLNVISIACLPFLVVCTFVCVCVHISQCIFVCLADFVDLFCFQAFVLRLNITALI